MNFGETIAYWYFRLNGFFPLMNFVVHRHDDVHEDREIDLLAVRFPHVTEAVGGQEVDWDNDRFNDWQLGHREKTVCVIGEIKTGGYHGDQIAKSFNAEKLNDALQRFGLLLPSPLPETVAKLSIAPSISEGGTTFAKVLMADSRHRRKRNVELPPCHQIELEDAVDFIEKRFDKYFDRKNAARVYFQNDIIQFLAWKAGLPVDDEFRLEN